MLKIVTSSPDGARRPSWKGFVVLNVVNQGEKGDVFVGMDKPRLFPGRYGPPIGEVLNMTRGEVILVNADIDLNLDGADLSQFEGGLAFSGRIDTPGGFLNPWAVDLFVYDDALVSSLKEAGGWEKFQLGGPWWDYVLPVAALCLGLPVWRITSPVAFHQIHERRWSQSDYLIGAAAARKHLGALGFHGPEEASEFSKACRDFFMENAEEAPILSGPANDLAWRYATLSPHPFDPRRTAPWPKRLERRARPYLKSAAKLCGLRKKEEG